MKTTMKRLEYQAVLQARRFAKAWDYFCIATGSYMAGYNDAKQDSGNDTLGNEIVEHEVTDGMHQLSIRSFQQWEKETYGLPFKEAFKIFMHMFNVKDLRVVEDENGISFQGTVTRKKANQDFIGVQD